jgi:hypothetical protein
MPLLLLLLPVVLSLLTPGIAGVDTWFASRSRQVANTQRSSGTSRRLVIVLVLAVLASGVIAALQLLWGDWRGVCPHASGSCQPVLIYK